MSVWCGSSEVRVCVCQWCVARKVPQIEAEECECGVGKGRGSHVGKCVYVGVVGAAT